MSESYTLLFLSTAGKVVKFFICRYIYNDIAKQKKEHRDHLNQLELEKTAKLTYSNAQLKVREQELSATNLKLRSSEQQLRSAMEQLEASNQQLIAGQKEIKESKTFLEGIFKTIKDGIIVSEEKGGFVKVNSAVEKITGYSGEELEGMHHLDLVVKDENHKKYFPGNNSSIEKGQTMNLKVAWCRKDGSVCPVEFNTKVLKDAEGNISGSISSIRDITERK